MTAKDLMKAGRLSEARRVLIEEVKAAPSDAGKEDTPVSRCSACSASGTRPYAIST
jgi:hypothetical protein